MVVSFSWCRSAFEYWPGPNDRGSGLFADASLIMLILGCLSFSAFLGIHFYLWRQKRRAIRMAAVDAGLGVGGSASASGASSPLIFPLYNKILVFCTLATLIDTLNGLFIGTGGLVNRSQGGGNALLASILYGGVWAVYHFVFEGIALLMLNPGVGSFAARKSAGLAFIWAMVTWFVQTWSNYADGDTISMILSVMWSCSLIVFYLVLWLAPLRILFRRPCVYSYARFWALMRLFVSIANVLRFYEFTSGFCLYILAVAGFQSPTVAYVVYTCLLRDCQYWLGILRWEESGYSNPRARTAKDLSSPSSLSSGSFLGGSGSFANPKANGPGGMETLRRPLLGTSLAPHSARMLAAKMDSSKNSDGGDSAPIGANGSPQANAKRKQGGVRILNFAFLRIDQPVDDDLDGVSGGASVNKPQQIVLGSGSTSRVFQGTFRDRPVAIKMIFCPDLTPETVASFYHEATLLAQLSHPNVVDVLGVCVLPPAICLVMELCDGGNLFDFLRAPAQVANPLSLYRQLSLCADACAAVHFLHSQVPAVLHLDLKSLNFLLSTQTASRPGQIVLKVADLELSREIIIAEPDADEEEKRMATITMGGGAPKARRKASNAGDKKTLGSNVPSSAVVSGSELTGFKIPEQLYWLAPELMQGLPYSEKADIYSLALVIWEIFTASVPYRSLEDSLILAARYAKYRELTGLGPEAEYALNGDPVTPGGRKSRARTTSTGSNGSNATERHTPAMAGASIGAPTSAAAMSNAHAPRDRTNKQQGRRSRSTSRRRHEEEEAELASTPSSGQSSQSHSSAPSPQSPLRGQQHFFAGGAAGSTAGASGAMAVPNGTTGPQVITAQTLGVSPPSFSNLAPSTVPHVIPTRASPPTSVVPAAASNAGTASLTQENLNSYQADAPAPTTAAVRPGTASSQSSSSLAPPKTPIAAILSPVHSNEPMDTDPILSEWKRMHHHMHTHPILSPGRGSGSNFQSPLTQALQNNTASPPLLPLTPSAMQRVGGQRSVRPNLPTVPASTGNSLLGESNMPADPDLAAASALAAEEARLDPLSQEGSTSDSFSLLHPSDSGLSSHSPSANAGKPHYLARSAPFQSDLSPITASLRQTPQSGMSSRSDREAAGELAFPPPTIAATNQREPAQIRQFSAPVGGSRLGAEPYAERDDSNLLGAEEADFSTHTADAAAAAASAEGGDPSARGCGSDAGSNAGSDFDPAAFYPSSLPLRSSGESVLLGPDSDLAAQSSMAPADPAPGSASNGGAGGAGGNRIVPFHGAKTMPVTGSNSTALTHPGGTLSVGHSNASSPTPTSQRVPRVTNLPLKAQRRPESRKQRAAASSAAAKKPASDANVSTASASDSSMQRATSPATSSAPGAPRPVSFASIWVSRHEVQSQLRHLICVEHYRPTLPADMPDALASLLTRAWHPLPAHRPTAGDFVNTILNLTHQLKDQESNYMSQHNAAFNSNRSGEANGSHDRPREEQRDTSERKEEQH